jgi:hypothetical protein
MILHRSPALRPPSPALPMGNPRRVLGFSSGELVSFWARWSSASKFGRGGRGGDGDITMVWPTETTNGDRWTGELWWIGNWPKIFCGMVSEIFSAWVFGLRSQCTPKYPNCQHCWVSSNSVEVSSFTNSQQINQEVPLNSLNEMFLDVFQSCGKTQKIAILMRVSRCRHLELGDTEAVGGFTGASWGKPPPQRQKCGFRGETSMSFWNCTCLSFSWIDDNRWFPVRRQMILSNPRAD